MGKNREVGMLAEQALAAIRRVRMQAQLHEAMVRFQEVDQDGNVLGLLPHSDSGIAALEAIYQQDPENFRICHHLAIARHSRAWDWEIEGDARAVGEWAVALEYWRKLQTCSEFWQELKERFAVLASPTPNSACGWIEEMRRNLLEQLIEIHAAFICHYHEMGCMSKARAHVEIIRKALIPPAARDKLLARVFNTMVAPVSDARLRKAYESALAAVDRFLELFSDYLPALRLVAETADDWLSTLSYEHGWSTIEAVAARVWSVAIRL
jgi:hypothetical protein